MTAARTSRVVLAFAAMLVTSSCWALYLNEANPRDVDKGPADWVNNWYNDANNNNAWDFTPDQPNPPQTEAWADVGVAPWKSARDETCWVATAANMLSAGGYGDSAMLYGSLIDHFGWSSQGAIDSALAWYVAGPGAGVSQYAVIGRYDAVGGLIGGLSVRDFVSDRLREIEYVGLEIKPIGAGTDHAITVWGDNLAANWQVGQQSAATIHVSDSDLDVAGDYVDPALDPLLDTYSWSAPQPNWDLNYGQKQGQGYWVQSVVTLGATPEPGTLGLFGLGALAGAAVLLRRRRS